MPNNFLKTVRKNAGLTQKEIARKLGLSQGSLTSWETGQKTPTGKLMRPSWKTCGILAELLGTTQEAMANSFGIPSPEQHRAITQGLKAGVFSDEEFPELTVSLEHLFHHRCSSCGKWWSIADIVPKDIAICPQCGQHHKVAAVVDGWGKAWVGVGNFEKVD